MLVLVSFLIERISARKAKACKKMSALYSVCSGRKNSHRMRLEFPGGRKVMTFLTVSK